MRKIFLLLIAVLLVSGMNSQTKLWGVTSLGGNDNAGTIFKTDINGTNHAVEYNFNQIDASGNGSGSVIGETSDGRYFGMTPAGGKYNYGVLFEYNIATNVYTKKFEFDGAVNGKYSQGGLMQASNGKIYGMTNQGGANNLGVLFEYNHVTNTFTKILDFNGTNGSGPQGNLFEAQDGMLYGLVNSGGSIGGGVLFQLDPVTNAYTIKYNFSSSSNDGYNPNGTLIQAPDGKLYGLTNGGGTSANGTIFQFDLTTNTYTKKFDFSGAADGSRPQNALVLASDDMMYGTTYYGGVNDKGVLFQYNYHTNVFLKKYDFNFASGENPWGTLIQALDGSLYGFTDNGGSSQNVGTLFQYNPVTSAITKKFDFGAGKGSHVRGQLLEANNGKFYAVGNYGALGLGVIFEYDPVLNNYTKKIEFGDSPGGKTPQNTLLKAKDGKLYGTVTSGGSNGMGAIFLYDPVTHMRSNIFNFDSISGFNDQNMGNCRTLIEAQDGTFYGTTTIGGANNLGVLFQFNPVTLVYSKKHDFASDGSGYYPVGTLLQIANGMIYGLTNNGGGTNSGTIYQYNPISNAYVMKFGFPVNTDGNRPKQLVQINDSIMFGIAGSGGATNGGTIFQYNILRNMYLKKYDFGGNFGSIGNGPSSFMLASDGKMYGTLAGGGSAYLGGVFKYDAVTNIVNYFHSFGSITADGKYSYHNLLEATNGKLYGLTQAGGINDKGIIFEVDPPSNSYTKLFDFSGTDGNAPTSAGLLEVGDTIITKPVTTTICAGNKINVPFAMVGNFQTGNVFNVQLSDASGSFTSPTTLGSFTAPLIGNVNVPVPLGATPGNAYRVRVVSTNPVMIGSDNGSNIAINAFVSPTVAVSNGTICVGKTFTMTPSGCVSYTYSSGTATVAPTHDSTFTIIGANTYGCLDTVSCLVHVNPTPTITTNSSPTGICAGSSSTLTATGAQTYTWNPGGLIGNNVVVTPTVSTNYFVTGSDANGCTALSNYYLNVSSSNVSYAISPTLVCPGATATITASGLNTYTWYPGAITSNSISVIAGAATIYTVQGNFATGCIATKTINFAAATVSVSGSASAICPGNNAFLSATGMSTYTWNPGSLTSNNIVVSPTISTTYSLTGGTGTCTSTKTIAVTVNPTPTIVVSGGMICSGQSFTISPSGAISYTYSSGSAVVSPTVNTSFTVTGTNASGCSNIAVGSVSVNPLPTLTVNNGTVCSGNSFTIVPGGAITYSFSGGAAIVSPTATTNYTVTGTNSNSCSNTVISTVSVNAIPSLTISPAPELNCLNSVVGVTCAATGTFTWSGPGISSGANSNIVDVITSGIYSVTVTDANTCSNTGTVAVNSNTTAPVFSLNPTAMSVCLGSSVTISANLTGTNSVSYLWDNSASTQSINVNPTIPTTYTATVTDNVNGCYSTNTITINVYALPNFTITGTNTVCIGTSTAFTANGAFAYTWNTGQASSTIYVNPTVSSTYTVTGTDFNGCTNSETVSIAVDNSCADVWPGDANSDGMADNLDVLELGLHYTQTGAPRATTSNNWQSYFSNNWVGTITNGKNVNHSDCNGDGIINDDDTLAIYNNYSLTHAFKPAQTTTVNPQLSIVPDQAMVTKGSWGTASVYLGDATNTINNINGIAFTVDFDNTLIEPNSIYIEYQNSFIDVSQNLYFRKLDFANEKIFTATTHTVNNNVNGFGKIATLHYQILSSLTTDQTLTIGLSQANQSDASGLITPLTSGAGTLLAVGSSVGIKETLNSNNVSVSPNPTNGVLNITFGTIPQNTKIEVYNSLGALVLTETLSNKNNTINTSQLSNGMFLIKVLENNRITTVQKIVKQ